MKANKYHQKEKPFFTSILDAAIISFPCCSALDLKRFRIDMLVILHKTHLIILGRKYNAHVMMEAYTKTIQ